MAYPVEEACEKEPERAFSMRLSRLDFCAAKAARISSMADNINMRMHGPVPKPVSTSSGSNEKVASESSWVLPQLDRLLDLLERHLDAAVDELQEMQRL